MTHYDICGVCMAISVIFIRLNLIVYPIVCYRCWTHCNRFNASSEILSVVAEGLYYFNKTHLHAFPLGPYITRLTATYLTSFIKSLN